MDKISIFEYMDVNAFLQDYVKARKGKEPKFSYSVWAMELGFNNKTILRLIVQGKRPITEKSKIKFHQFFKLKPEEAEYFDALVEFSQSRTKGNQSASGTRLIQLQRKRYSPLEIPANGGLLRDPLGPIILSAISSSESSCTKTALKNMFNLSDDQLDKLIESLRNQSLIKVVGDQIYSSQNSFKILDNYNQNDLRNFYRYWIEKSISAMDLPFAERRFKSLQLVLSAEEFEMINKEFAEFVNGILSKVEHNTLGERRMYIMNNVLFPATTTSEF